MSTIANTVAPDRSVSNATPDASTTCAICDETSQGDARFCRRCGTELAVTGPKPQTPTHGIAFFAIIGAACILISVLAIVLFQPTDSGTPLATATAVETKNTVLPATPAVVTNVIIPPPPVAPPVAPDQVPAAQPVHIPSPHYYTAKTPMLGATTGGGPFRTVGQDNEPLLGFRIVMDRWDRLTIVRSLEPVFASDHVVVTASMVVADPGYAVGGIVVDGDQHVTAMRVIFMRRKGHALDPNDSYSSDWFGQQTGQPVHLLGGTGDRVVGVFGRNGLNVDAIGLILQVQSKSAE